jgi:putative photosynthetic complex assembly protein
MTETTPTSRPQWPIAAACALVLASIAAVAAVRASGMPITPPDAATIAERELRFVDRPDGSVAVLDAASGRQVDAVVGESGFVRGTLRGLARERKRQGIGPDQAFRLIARADGRLTLLDPQTGRRVDLESFGPTNAAEFGHMLSAAEKMAALHPRN